MFVEINLDEIRYTTTFEEIEFLVSFLSNFFLKIMEESPKNKQNWLIFTQIGLQMALTIGLGTWGGYWLDAKMANKNPIATLVLSLLSIGVSLYNVIRQIPKN